MPSQHLVVGEIRQQLRDKLAGSNRGFLGRIPKADFPAGARKGNRPGATDQSAADNRRPATHSSCFLLQYAGKTIAKRRQGRNPQGVPTSRGGRSGRQPSPFAKTPFGWVCIVARKGSGEVSRTGDVLPGKAISVLKGYGELEHAFRAAPLGLHPG